MNSKQFISKKLNRKKSTSLQNPTEKTCKKHNSRKKKLKKMKKNQDFTNFSTYYAEKTKNITLKKSKNPLLFI